ncbi:MAG: phosphoesterase [Planctomycetes bacterium]|nr:phosphoesterase [Planctomycetota bacterium]
MKVYALSDPHLSFGTPNKAMDRFGPQWVDHPRKIAAAWRERVGTNDIVLVPGDVSWAMTLEQAKPDLDWLAALPGHKVLLKGNHDYWWSTIGKVRAAIGPRMHAIQGDVVSIGGVAIAGTRLWDQAGVSFRDAIDWRPGPGGMVSAEPEGDRAAEAARIFERELGRLERAMAALAQEGRAAALRIAVTHYPPCGGDLAATRATDRIEAAGARHCVFGHLHSLRRDLATPLFGQRGGTEYVLASCDWLDFAPRLVASV